MRSTSRRALEERQVSITNQLADVIEAKRQLEELDREDQ